MVHLAAGRPDRSTRIGPRPGALPAGRRRRPAGTGLSGFGLLAWNSVPGRAHRGGRAVIVCHLRPETREIRVRCLPWPSSGHVTVRSMSPQLPSLPRSSRLAQMEKRRMQLSSFVRAISIIFVCAISIIFDFGCRAAGAEPGCSAARGRIHGKGPTGRPGKTTGG